jgi:2-dehydropantoate 2-reductase
MRIAVVGSGGIGGYVGIRLAQAGEVVAFVARGAHLAAMRRDGFRLECPLGDVTLADVEAGDDPAAIGPVDLVLFAVKLGATDAAAGALAPLIGETTRIVTLQNGIDAKDLIARHVEERRIAAGCTYLSASIGAPGVIHAPGGAHAMTIDGLSGDPVVARFVAACRRAIGLEAAVTDNIRHVLWDKFVRLVAFSGATCLARAPIGVVLGHPETSAFLHSIIAENLAVAERAGQAFAPDKAESSVAFFRSLHPATKSSMLIDLEAGKPLEMPWLQGRVLELGRAHGLPTPSVSAVVAALAPHVGGRP